MGRWSTFSPHRDGTVTVRLGALRQVLTGQLRELAALLDDTRPNDGGAEPDPLAVLTGMTDVADRAAPDDPALRRLRPDAYGPEVEGGEAAAEYRRLAGGSLASLQRERVATVLDTLTHGDRFDLSPAEAQAWLGALNDLRLVLATRIGVVDDDAPPPATPAGQLYLVYGSLQHELLVALGAPDEF